jgi:hypothetical protein
MTNLERVKMEIKGIDFTEEELNIYLSENIKIKQLLIV